MPGLLTTPRSLWTPDMLRENFERAVEEARGVLWAEAAFELDEAATNKEKRAVSGVARDSSVGRSGGFTYDFAGMDIKHFNEKNPVALAAHNQIVPLTLEPAAIARIAKVTKNVKDGLLLFRDMTFDETPLANAWYEAIVRGFVRMVSIGAMPIEWELVEEEDKRRKRVNRYINITESELIEISPVPIGNNRGAFIDPRHVRSSDAAPSAAAMDGGLGARIARLEAALQELQAIVVESGVSDDEPPDGDAAESPAGQDEAYGDASFPDAAFIVETGAPKVGGKTVHRYRHLPHHSKSVKSGTDNGSVDIPHLRNALARVGQVKPVKESKAGYVARARRHLNSHARALLKSHKDALDILESLPAGLDDEPRAENEPQIRFFDSAARLRDALTNGASA